MKSNNTSPSPIIVTDAQNLSPIVTVTTSAKEPVLRLPAITPAREAKLAQIFYEPENQRYWWPKGDWWTSVNETSIQRLLTAMGFSRQSANRKLSQVEQALAYLQTKNAVDYAGPLAGHRSGLVKMHGHHILVSRGATPILPRAGSWTNLRQFLARMLGGEDGPQLAHFFGLHKVALEAYRRGGGRPGQMLVLCGRRNTGKSLWQDLTTELYGGRVAKPYRFLTGTTDFNYDLFGAEHLMIEDEASSTDMRVRLKLGAECKGLVANRTHRMHRKMEDPIMLDPIWRATVTVNSDRVSLDVLPPLDDGLRDKLMLMQTSPQPFCKGDLAAWAGYRETLLAELPAFVAFLAEWQIPPELMCERFGVKYYHHPEIAAALERVAPEEKLWGMIQTTVLAQGQGGTWTGSAAELEEIIRSDRTVGQAADMLFTSNLSVGRYLSRLANYKPQHVRSVRSATRRDWHLTTNPMTA